MKKDIARNEVTKQSPKNNRDAKAIDCHELYEKPGEIASLRSQNPYTYFALLICTNFNRKMKQTSTQHPVTSNI